MKKNENVEKLAGLSVLQLEKMKGCIKLLDLKEVLEDGINKGLGELPQIYQDAFIYIFIEGMQYIVDGPGMVATMRLVDDIKKDFKVKEFLSVINQILNQMDKAILEKIDEIQINKN